MGVMSKLGNFIDDIGNSAGEVVAAKYKTNATQNAKDIIKTYGRKKDFNSVEKTAKARAKLRNIDEASSNLQNAVGSGVSGAVVGYASGAVIGGIEGGVNEDETFLGGMVKGAVIGGAVGAGAGATMGHFNNSSRLTKGVAEKISSWKAGEGA